jgi:hypothetical protein
VKLSKLEYESIFENPPTFQEKKAFVEVFRKKWREDKGYCSLFDKLQAYKSAAQRSRGALAKSQLNQSSQSPVREGIRPNSNAMIDKTSYRDKIMEGEYFELERRSGLTEEMRNA